jgi:hypothetical protein
MIWQMQGLQSNASCGSGFGELCDYRGESVSDTLHELIEQWVTKVESMKTGLTR